MLTSSSAVGRLGSSGTVSARRWVRQSTLLPAFQLSFSIPGRLGPLLLECPFGGVRPHILELDTAVASVLHRSPGWRARTWRERDVRREAERHGALRPLYPNIPHIGYLHAGGSSCRGRRPHPKGPRLPCPRPERCVFLPKPVIVVSLQVVSRRLVRFVSVLLFFHLPSDNNCR